MSQVRLVASTTPVIEGVRSAEDLIVYCARVSNPSNQLNMETGERLLRYCMQHGHWSVFEQASMTVEIRTSRAIAAQIIRHRSFAFQEFSQRYAEVAEAEPVELRLQAESNRQSSTEPVKSEFVAQHMRDAIASSLQAYRLLIKHGVARECARMVLPMAASTTLYMTGSCRSWIHYLQQRTDKHTQLEHWRIAMDISELCFARVFPTVHAMLEEMANA
jgi:thymidylate synthase (FAD)